MIWLVLTAIVILIGMLEVLKIMIIIQQEKRHDSTRFRFCEIRRRLMALARDGRVNVKSPTFGVLYYAVSDHIRHHHRSRYSLRECVSFLSTVKIPPPEIVKAAREDLKKQPPEVIEIGAEVFDAIMTAFRNHSFALRLLILLVQIMSVLRLPRANSIAHAKQKAEEYQAFSNDLRSAFAAAA